MKRTVVQTVAAIVGCVGVFAVPTAPGLLDQSQATAQESPCFMITGTGQRVSLEKMCAWKSGSPANPQVKSVHQARIKRRNQGTPVIEVTFNGSSRFEMLLDTGASGTLITRSMAAALRIPVVGARRFVMADGRSVVLQIGRVRSMSVDGAEVRDVPVAIAPEEGAEGLLGQDFFGNYDIKIKQNVVEFYRR